MLSFVQDDLGSIIVLIVLIAIVALIIFYMIRKHKKGKSCGCNCGCCGNTCKTQEEASKKAKSEMIEQVNNEETTEDNK